MRRVVHGVRRSWCSRNLAAIAAPLVAIATALAPQLASAADRFVPAAPEAGVEIPAATIKFGMRPYADNTFYIIGMKKGWFTDVGISFDPAPYGLKANDFERHHPAAQRAARPHLRILPAHAADLQGCRQAQVHRVHRQLPGQRDPGQSQAQAEDVQGIHCRRAVVRGRAQGSTRTHEGQDAGRCAAAQRPCLRRISQQDVGRRVQAPGAG